MTLATLNASTFGKRMKKIKAGKPQKESERDGN